MGYNIAHRMRFEECLVALHMAIKNRQYMGICIHHSDRGKQYISKEYTDVIKDNSFVSSTTQDGSPYDNAVAQRIERINRILKEESKRNLVWMASKRNLKMLKKLKP